MSIPRGTLYGLKNPHKAPVGRCHEGVIPPNTPEAAAIVEKVRQALQQRQPVRSFTVRTERR